MTDITVHLDFETRSRADISLGSWEYSLDPSTEVTCWAARTDGRPHDSGRTMIKTCPLDYDVLPRTTIWAQNVQFEQAIWRNVCGWPEPKAWRCTMALCASYGLPQSLQKASEFFGLAGKHDAGHKMMLKCCSPQKKTGEFYQPTPTEFEELLAYCRHDVELESEIHKRLGELDTLHEIDVWKADNAMNLRGIGVDRELCDAATKVIGHLTKLQGEGLDIVTNGELGADDLTNPAKILDWINAQGVELDELTKASVSACLRRKELSTAVRTVLQLRQRASRISMRKFDSILAQTQHGGRLRGHFRYSAARNKRWKSKGESSFRGKDEDSVQLQNLPKPEIPPEAIPEAIAATLRHDLNGLVAVGGGDPAAALVSLVRPALVPKAGHVFAIVDYAAIEARTVLWAAEDDYHLEWFRKSDAGLGREPYCIFADSLYGKTITNKAAFPKERNAGKVGVLLSGFQGGPDTLDRTAKTWGIDLIACGTTPEAVVDAFRKEFQSLAGPKGVGFWKRMDQAANYVVTTKKNASCARVKLSWENRIHPEGTLVLTLPSGSKIYYHRPRLEWVEKEYQGRKYQVEQLFYWDYEKNFEQSIYGGKWAENIASSIARDLTADALVLCEHYGLNPVLVCHDEIVCEVPTATAEADLARMENIMTDMPDWAHGLPIAVEGYQSQRYAKHSMMEDILAA